MSTDTTQANNHSKVEVEDINDQIRIRREKLQELRDQGKDPFHTVHYEVSDYVSTIKEDFESYEGKNVKLAGRLMSKRGMGKVSFCDLLDSTGRIQLMVRIDALGEESYGDWKKLDLGDQIGVEGEIVKTKTGEITCRVHSYELLAKCIRPLPEKYHGLSDQDTRYRQRYLDLIVNPEVKDTFRKRSQIISSIRSILDEKSFIEVETPILNTIPGGASARPFITHHNTLDLDMYLRIAPELYLKRLIVGGFDRVYEVGRNFRNEGMDSKHNPEFSMIELYQAYTDYKGMMDLTEELIHSTSLKVNGTTELEWGGQSISLARPFRRLTMQEAVLEYAKVDFSTIKTDDEAFALAKEHNIEVQPAWKKGDVFNAFFEEYAEANLIQPTFIYDYPIEVSPLTKKKPSDPSLTERFELFIAGHEFANAYSELNDPIDQKERFDAQMARRDAGDDEANFIDDDYVLALEYALPPTGGMGMGIDRLCMLLTGETSIRDVLLFPTMKPLGGEKRMTSVAKPVNKEENKTLQSSITRADAFMLLAKYNKEDFHIQHALTVEAVMRWFAKALGFEQEEEFWGITGLLHDLDFEQWPEEHCQKAPELLRDAGVNEEMIHAICSHAYGSCTDVAPEHLMEKVLFASDELTGLIWSASLMRPSKSTKDMELSSVKKKFKDKKFAAGCSRDIIREGATILGWELDVLLEKTLQAMQATEDEVAAAMEVGIDGIIANAKKMNTSNAVSVENASLEIDFSKVEIEPLFEDLVDFETFSKSDFRVVKVKDCVAVPKSKKLLQFTLDDGTGKDRVILSGIHPFYEPEDLIGKTCVAIVNLPPRAMMGIDSCGMLLSATHQVEGEEKLQLLILDSSIPAGAKIY